MEDEEFNEIIGSTLDDDGARITQELERLHGKDYLDFYLKLLEFVLPKLEPQTIDSIID